MVTRGGNTRVAAGKTEHIDLRLAVPSVSAVSCGSRFARHGPVRPCEVRAVSPPRLSRTAETAWCDSALTRGRGEARGGRGRPPGPGKMAYKAGASALYVGSAFLPRQSVRGRARSTTQRAAQCVGLWSSSACCSLRSFLLRYAALASTLSLFTGTRGSPPLATRQGRNSELLAVCCVGSRACRWGIGNAQNYMRPP